LALAISTPKNDQVMLVDADPDGGDLAPVLGTPASPGLVTLAAATRHRFSTGELERHLQLAAPGVPLLAAPSSAEQASASLMSLGRSFAESLASSNTIADVGRWKPGSAAADLVREASATVLVVHPTVAGVSHARFQFEDLATRCPRVVVACRGERPYSAEEVAAAIGCASTIAIPADRVGASMITGRSTDRWLRRSALARAARTLGASFAPVEEVVS
jgi:hypothetical protein